MSALMAYEFGPFRLEPGEHRLRAGDTLLPLTPRACEVLLHLVRNSGQLQLKDALLQQVWAQSFVEESNLTQTVYVLRKTLASVDPLSEYIETVPRKGYRFRAAVREVTIRTEQAEIRRGPVAEAALPMPPAVARASFAAKRWLAAGGVLLLAIGIMQSMRPASVQGSGEAAAVAPPPTGSIELVASDPAPFGASYEVRRRAPQSRGPALEVVATRTSTPDDVRQAIDLCYLMYVNRLSDQATNYCQTALQAQPDQVQGHLFLGLIAQQQRDNHRALRYLERARRLARGDSYYSVLEAMGGAYAAAGNSAAAAGIHHQLEQAARERVAARASAAGLKATLGDVEGAVRDLQAMAPGRELPADLLLDPRYEALRAHPRFRALRAGGAGLQGGSGPAAITVLADAPE